MPDARSIKDLMINPHGVQETWLREAEKQLIKGYTEYSIEKYLSDGKVAKLDLKILHPNQDVDLLVSEGYTHKFNTLMNNSDFQTWDELRKNLDKRGLWTDEDEERNDNSGEVLRNAVFQMATYIRKEKLDKKKLNAKEEKKFAVVQKKYDDIEFEMQKLNIKRYKYWMQSIEGQAHQHAIYIKLIHCIVKADDSRLWPDLDAFQKEPAYNRDAIAELSTVAYQFWSGMSQEILQYLPESDFGGGTKNDSETPEVAV